MRRRGSLLLRRSGEFVVGYKAATMATIHLVNFSPFGSEMCSRSSSEKEVARRPLQNFV